MKFLRKSAIALSTSAFLFCSYYQQPHFSITEFYYTPSPFHNLLMSRFENLTYRPSFYMPTCLMQMIYSEVILAAGTETGFARETINARDGENIAIDWAEKTADAETLVVVFHGHGGGSNERYIQDFVKILSDKQKYKICMPHVRGANESILTLPVFFHAAFTDDMEDSLDHIKAQFPKHRVYVVGFSAGANSFVNLMAKTDKYNDYIKCFVSVSNPLEIAELESVNRGNLVDYVMTRTMKQYFEKHADVLSKSDSGQVNRIQYGRSEES